MNTAQTAKRYYEEDFLGSSEVSLSLSGFCIYLMEQLPDLMNIDTVQTYLYGPMYTKEGEEGHYNELYKQHNSRRIFEDCTKVIGWRNFMYILTQICGLLQEDIERTAKDYCVQNGLEYKQDMVREELKAYDVSTFVANYVADSELAKVDTKKDCIHLYVAIMLGATLVYSEKEGKGKWYKYINGRWMVVGREYVYSRISRFMVSDFCRNLGAGLTYRCDMGPIESMLAIPNFTEMLDKEDILSLPSCTFERSHLSPRSRLPGDLNSMQMGYDMEDLDLYAKKCPKMLEILDEYFDGDRKTTEFFLDCLSMAATGKFKARWATLLYGTGSDGKSTLIKIGLLIFASYSTSSAASLFSKESNDPNAPTPALEATINKLLVVIPDLGKHYIVGGSIFMQKTGEDDVYTRGLYSSSSNDRSKPYILMACDQLSGPRKLSELARIKAIFMKNKKATSEDIEVFNEHLAKQYKAGINSYGEEFAKRYGSTLVRYILLNISKVMRNNIVIPQKVKEDTKSWSNKNPVGGFCNRFLDKFNERQAEEAAALQAAYPNPKSEWSLNDTLGLVMPSISNLFTMWKAWIKMARDSSQGITTIDEFRSALSLFQSVKERIVQGGTVDFYVPNRAIVVRPEDSRVIEYLEPYMAAADYPMMMGGPSHSIGGYGQNPAIGYLPPSSSYDSRM